MTAIKAALPESSLSPPLQPTYLLIDAHVMPLVSTRCQRLRDVDCAAAAEANTTVIFCLREKMLLYLLYCLLYTLYFLLA